jgi:hypothetical protein
MPKKRRTSKKTSRKRTNNTSVETPPPEEEKQSKEELRALLRDKLNQKRLMRTSKFVRDRELDDIEEKLDDKRLPGKEKKKLKARMKLLEEVEDKIANANNLDFPDYVDTASYGGGMEN